MKAIVASVNTVLWESIPETVDRQRKWNRIVSGLRILTRGLP